MAKAKASIHFEKGSEGFFNHNDRTTPTVNSIFSDEKNEVSNTSQEAFRIYRNELQKRAEAYTKRTGQKLQKKAITHRSAIINLHQHHTLEDLKPLILKLEKDLDTKVLQVAIHRDEGHISDDGKSIKNYHAHIEIMGIDSQGISIAQNSFDKNNQKIRKRLDGSYYRDLQTFVAKTLKMERGQYNSKAKRLGTYEEKEHKRRESEALKKEKAKVKDLTQEIEKLKGQLQSAGAEYKQYAKLYELNRELKKQIKSKNLTIDDMRSQISELGTELFYEEQSKEITELKLALADEKISEIIKSNKSNKSKDEEIDNMRSQISELKKEVSMLQKNDNSNLSFEELRKKLDDEYQKELDLINLKKENERLQKDSQELQKIKDDIQEGKAIFFKLQNPLSKEMLSEFMREIRTAYEMVVQRFKERRQEAQNMEDAKRFLNDYFRNRTEDYEENDQKPTLRR